MKTTAKYLVLLCLLASLALAQTAMRTTTLTTAVTVNDDYVTVASATGIAARTNRTETIVVINGEAMPVRTVSGLKIGVERGGEGSPRMSHLSGAKVWVGPPLAFHHSAPSGSCTATSEGYLPRVLMTGEVWDCISSMWVQASTGAATTILNVGAAGTGVTAVEYGTDRQHITKLTFTSLALGTGASADLGFGALIYTLPAGAIIFEAAYMNVALTGSGAGCDADTPEMGLGTVIASGAVKVLSGTATFEDILTGQVVNNLTGTAEVITLVSTLARESGDAHTVHLNAADDWAGACAVTATGTVVLEWTLLN